MVAITRVSPTLLCDRLDGRYNAPKAVAIRKKILDSSFEIKNISELFSLVCGPFGSSLTADEHDDNGEVLLIQPTNITKGIFSEKSSWRISEKDLITKGLKKYSPGTLLFARVGIYPHVGVLPVSAGLATISSSMIAGKPKVEMDVRYISTFFQCELGYELLLAAQKITAQPTIGTNEIGATSIPFPKVFTQNFIGQKVSQAELLRDWAQGLESTADRLISKEFAYDLVPTMTNKPRRIFSTLLSPASLGPEFNRASEGQSLFENSSSLKKFIKSCKCGDPIRADQRVEGDCAYYGASGPIDTHNDFNFDGKYIIVAQDGSIGCASVSEGKIWANNHVWVLTTKDYSDADTIARYLNYHFPYWKGVTTGSVIPKVTSENLLNLRIPDNVATNVTAGDLLRKTKIARAMAQNLTESAKLLVESLIDGQVTEAQLIDAQLALEEGDNSKDRAILSKLSDKGYLADDGKPLFSDLDKLYELLDEAKAAVDANEESV